MTIPQGIPARGLKPATELARDRPCGIRLKYVAGCRCAACRRANTDYETARAKARKAGDWNGVVDAARARDHLRALRRRGIGRNAVATAADVARSIVQAVRAGTKKRLRARTERKLLAVGVAQRMDGALVPAARTHKLIADLLVEGYTKRSLALRMGYANKALQVGKKFVTLRLAHRFERLHNKLTT